MKFRHLTPAVLIGLVFLVICLASSAAVMSQETNCVADADKELSLPNGFCATVFTDKAGHARQLAVAPDGSMSTLGAASITPTTRLPPADT